MKSTSNLINPNLPTVTMPGMTSPLIRFLKKFQKGIPSALRYGNRAQAEAKRESLAASLKQEDLASAVVQVESRFLIAIFPAEYDLDQKTGQLITKHTLRDSLVRLKKTFDKYKIPRRLPFATVTGRRFNPRNRHNQNLPDDGPGLVYCQQTITRTESKAVRGGNE